MRTPAQGVKWVGPWREEVSGFSGTPGEPDDQVDGTVLSLHDTGKGVALDPDEVEAAVRQVWN